MNNIDELIEIINSIGGSATIDQISDVLAKKYGILIIASHKQVIETTLKNSKKVLFENNKYHLTKSEGNALNQNISRIQRIHNKLINIEPNIILYLNRKQICYKGLEIIENKNERFSFCFKNSSLKNQKQLDYLNEKYGVGVHYGSAKNYQIITYDVSKCAIFNTTNIAQLERGYYSCVGLTEDEAINAFEYLLSGVY